MKKFLKTSLLLTYALALVDQLLGNLVFDHPVISLIKVALILTLFELILKPVIKILLLPINILTLGLFRLVINTLGFYLAVFFLADFTVKSISTPEFSFGGLSIPPLNFQGFMSFLVTSFTTNIIFSFYRQILKPKKEHK